MQISPGSSGKSYRKSTADWLNVNLKIVKFRWNLGNIAEKACPIF